MGAMDCARQGMAWFSSGADRSKDDDAQADRITEVLEGAGSRQGKGQDGDTNVDSDAAGGKCVALFF